MFQFRRFPTYTYLIQCTLHGYCPCGLPHSEICGSMDICSSPQLIAACHVLRRLLMPRHSPCALFSLTCSPQSPFRSVSTASLAVFGENCAPFPCFSLPLKIQGFSMNLGNGNVGLRRVFTEIAILMNYAGFTKKFFEIVIVTLHPSGCCSTIKTYASHSFECLPLCCLTSLSSHCSVFKVQYFQPLLKPDLKIQIPLGFEIQQQTAVFCLVGLSGLEPPTLRLSVVRSSQLSYRPVWWR